MTQGEPGGAWPAWCEHGPCAHDPDADGPSPAATAPANARAWLLIEHDGPWAAEAVDTALPPDLAKLAVGAEELGIRLQLIRRPLRPERAAAGGDPAVFSAWTAGPEPWARRMSRGGLDRTALETLAAGEPPGGATEGRPLFLVCTHARRDRCCARFGVPLARDLAARYPDEVWETTHVGGHRFAGNLVILPHGLYYGPVGAPGARQAIEAYQRREIVARGYRGRAGQPAREQEAECAAAARSDALRL